MKLKSTLWALALAFAAVSCSDDLDSPNGKNTEKGETALINVMISTGVTTKAGDLPTGGENGDGSEAGSLAESKVDNVVVVLYQNDNSSDGYKVQSSSKIKAIGYTEVVSDPSTGSGIPNHDWFTSVEVKVADEGTTLADQTFGVITLVNTGNMTETINQLNPKTLGSLGDIIEETVYNANNKNHFVMSTHTIGGSTTGLTESTVTLRSNATEGNIPTVQAYVERLAAKIRLGEQESISDFSYPVMSEDKKTKLADVVLNSVAIVNQLNSGTYLLKRVSKSGYNVDSEDENLKDLGTTMPNDNPDIYLGDEVAFHNFVIDPWTRIKRLTSSGSFPTTLPTVESKTLSYIQPFNEVTDYETLYSGYQQKTVLTGTGATEFNGKKVTLCYTQENTSSVEGSVHGYSTGALFQATYYPVQWMVLNNDQVQAGNVVYGENKDPKDFYLYKSVIYDSREAIFASIVENMADENFTWAKIKNGISKTQKDAFLASRLASEKGPFGYVDYVVDQLNHDQDAISFSKYIETKDKSVLNGPNPVLYYEGGKCYYRYWIRHSNNGYPTKMDVMEFGIVRNNIYDLVVTEIGKLGLSGDEKPDPEEPDESDEFAFKVMLHVKDWTLRKNNIVF